VIKLDLGKRTFKCESVPGAAGYKVRIEVQSTKSGEWTLVNYFDTTEPAYTFNFTEAQVWQWTVAAVDSSGNLGRPSEWRTFRSVK